MNWYMSERPPWDAEIFTNWERNLFFLATYVLEYIYQSTVLKAALINIVILNMGHMIMCNVKLSPDYAVPLKSTKRLSSTSFSSKFGPQLHSFDSVSPLSPSSLPAEAVFSEKTLKKKKFSSYRARHFPQGAKTGRKINIGS